MSLNQPIDLSRLPLPEAVEVLDFETILSVRKALLVALHPELADVLALESEPIVKLLEENSFRELLIRARVNDSVRAVLLPTATGADLENLASLFGVERKIVVDADPAANPPVLAVYEDDAALRRRTQLSLEGLTNAGTVGSYTYHALSADGRVRDVGVTRPAPGHVLVTVLSHEDDGTPSADVLNVVRAVLEDVRPLCDDTSAAGPVFSDFSVTATLVMAAAPGAEVARAAAEAAVRSYLEDAMAVGRVIRRSALIARLHQEGVENVQLITPAADVDPGPTGVARATTVTIGVSYPA